MNIKKIIAGVAASALAVSAMAITASAGVVKSSLKNAMDDGSGNFQVFIIQDGESYYDIDVTKVASIDVTLSNNASGDEAWVGGKIITQCDAKSWDEIGSYTSVAKAEDTQSNKWTDIKIGGTDVLTFETPNGFAADSTYVIVTVQSYAAEGIEVNVDNVVLKDASGNVLLDVANPATSDDTTAAESKPEESKDNSTTEAPATTTGAAGNTNKPTDDKNNADTGIEGVAVVAGLAVIAAGAVVVAKKRK